MNEEIIVDSCCDIPYDLADRIGIVSVPFFIRFGEKQFCDDRDLDMAHFLPSMIEHNGRITTSTPTPDAYREAFLRPNAAYAVTISGNLSGSHNCAVLAEQMAREESHKQVHVFDSKSASAGQVLVTLTLRRMIDECRQSSDIIADMQAFIRDMKTYFVLENVTNLLKNGRLGLIKGLITTLLKIKPIMGSDGDGNIALFSKARSRSRVLEKMLSLIEDSGRPIEGQTMVITHCNNAPFAERLADAVRQRFCFKEILIYPTHGLSAVYADNQGVVMAF